MLRVPRDRLAANPRKNINIPILELSAVGVTSRLFRQVVLSPNSLFTQFASFYGPLQSFSI